jgi:hypothetical protein
MWIDAETGTVRLGNGLTVSPDLTTERLLAAPFGAKPYNHSPLPYRWYSSEGGELDGVPFRAEFCFYEGAVVHADLHAETLPEVFTDPTSFSPAHWEERAEWARARYRDLLRENLGEPRATGEADEPPSSSVAFLWTYTYPWGHVHLCGGVNHFIRVEYAGRREGADKRFRTVDTPEHLTAATLLRERLAKPPTGERSS